MGTSFLIKLGVPSALLITEFFVKLPRIWSDSRHTFPIFVKFRNKWLAIFIRSLLIETSEGLLNLDRLLDKVFVK